MLRAGHAAAFEAIYDRHHAHILSFCRHMLGSREDAEDAAQQTFISAHGSLVGSDKTIHLRAWLYAIARNRCLSILRGRHQTRSLEAEGAEHLAATDGLSEIVKRREDLRELVAGLASLPERQRSALVLFELEDLSQAQIADVLECDAKQVKALVFQARTALMNERDARAMDCGEVRIELANARGAARLRGPLRRHLRSCTGCREFAAGVRGQRTQLALVLPVVPAAGLRAATMAATVGSHAGWSAGTGGGIAAVMKGALTKAIVAAAVAGVGTGAAVAVIGHSHHRRHPAAPGAAVHRHQPPASTGSLAIPDQAGTQVERHGVPAGSRRRHHRRHGPHRGAAALAAPGAGVGSHPQLGAGASPGQSVSAHRHRIQHQSSAGRGASGGHSTGRGHHHGAARRGTSSHGRGPASSGGSRGNHLGRGHSHAANPGGANHGRHTGSSSPPGGSSGGAGNGPPPQSAPQGGGQVPPGHAKQDGGGGNGGGNGPGGAGPPGHSPPK